MDFFRSSRITGRAESTMALNTKVNKEVFDKFKDDCKRLGYPLNVLLETFMQQYANDRYDVDTEDVLKWKYDDSEKSTLNTTFNKEIYLNFKDKCKNNGFFVKHVVIAFMNDFTKEDLIMEFVNTNKIKKE